MLRMSVPPESSARRMRPSLTTPPSPAPKIQPREVRRLRAGGDAEPETDLLVVEEPLEIRIAGRPIAVVMRTPGDDEALVRGFLLTEAIVDAPDRIAAVRVDAGERAHPRNVVAVDLADGAPFDPDAHARQFYATSSCGICGKSSLEAVRLAARPVVARWTLPAAALLAMPVAMRVRQETFTRTGSLHAAALFDASGLLLDLAEDVGRHNAVDKIVGRASVHGPWPLEGRVLFVSGRISFEIAQKALMAGVAVIGGVSGASTLAVDLAEDHGLTLAGFVRDGGMVVYSGAWRIECG